MIKRSETPLRMSTNKINDYREKRIWKCMKISFEILFNNVDIPTKFLFVSFYLTWTALANAWRLMFDNFDMTDILGGWTEFCASEVKLFVLMLSDLSFVQAKQQTIFLPSSTLVPILAWRCLTKSFTILYCAKRFHPVVNI